MTRLRVEYYMMRTYPQTHTCLSIAQSLGISKRLVNTYLLDLEQLAIVERRKRTLGGGYNWRYVSRVNNRSPKINGELQAIYESIPYGSKIGITEFIEGQQTKEISSHQLRRVLRLLSEDGLIHKIPDMTDLRKSFYMRKDEPPIDLDEFYKDKRKRKSLVGEKRKK